MTMAHSVKARFPFLDHELVGFVNRLPRSHKLCGSRYKRILRESMTGLLPDSIRDRPKFAYHAPEIRAFVRKGQAAGRLVETYLSDDAVKSVGLFKPDAVRMLLRKAELLDVSRMGTRDNMAFVQMLSTHIFHSQFVKGDMRSAASAKLAALPVRTRIDLRSHA